MKNNIQFINYLNLSISCEGKTYQSSLWFDYTNDRYLWRITSPTTGKPVRTFTSHAGLVEYVSEQNSVAA